jgi:hypothetical protein
MSRSKSTAKSGKDQTGDLPFDDLMEDSKKVKAGSEDEDGNIMSFGDEE